LPGMPGKKGIIPYEAVFDTQAQARKRGYWIPGVPVNAKIVKVERNTDRRIHLINTLLYTIQLEHGQFKWSVVRNYKDFTALNSRLKAHRAAQQFLAPVRRAQERVDAMLESVGIDVIPDHKEDCPYYRSSHRRRRHDSKLPVLKRDADPFEDTRTASVTSPGSTSPELEEARLKIAQAVQSGIMQEEGDAPEERGTKKRRTRKKHTLPHFPIIPDSMVSNLETRKDQLENWLQMLLHIPINRNHHETAEFLEVSRFSFVNELGGKHTEGFVKKRPGGARVFLGWKQCCVRYFLPWSKRWLMVRDSFVAYMDHRTERIRLVLLMDKDFKVAAGGKEADGIPTGLIIFNTQHELHLKCRRIEDTARWKAIIEEAMNGIGNIWIQPHRFSSSFPIREKSYGKWFVDARSYMSHAADMMELAREEIFIAGWWLSPEIYMKRPALEGNYWRLDEILKRKANQGVHIFILMYKEMEMALGLNSMYSKRTFQALHPNIKVMRHPDHYPSTGTFFWAHHEKLVIIDQLIAFVGGVDLCFGRWDDHHHLLTDLGSVQFGQQHLITQDINMASGLRALVSAPLTLSPLGLEENEEVDSSKGAEAPDKNEGKRSSEDLPNRCFIAHPPLLFSLQRVTEILSELITTTKNKISPTLQRKRDEKILIRSIEDFNRECQYMAGPPPSVLDKATKMGLDFSTAVEKYKEYVESGAVQKEKHRSQTPPLKRRESRFSRVVDNWKSNRARKKWKQVLDSDEVTAGYELDFLRLKQMDSEDKDSIDGGVKLWIGKDYVNYIHKDFVEVDLPFHDFIDRGATPRMPWHDIHSVTFGVPARDVARHFIQRWNATKTEKLKDDESLPYLLPKSYENLKVPRVFKNPAFSYNVDIQVLRSLSNWSGLINQTEDSIQMAYLSLIANSKHFIYIENQFFVSMIDSNDVLNEICKVICNRVIRAYKEKEPYRVYIMIPLMPGFEGNVGAPGGSSLQAVLHWTYQSLSRGPNSLFERLKVVVPNPRDYISVCSLRSNDVLCGKLVTELIYVHCKLLIVDDEHVIIGSANINDRSQVGNRDSEVCLLFSDTEKEPSIMNGRPYAAGKFAKSLRVRCMQEHLGLLPDARRPSHFKYDVSLDDPVAESFFVDVWQNTARSNMLIYEEVFRTYPTDNVETFEEFEKWTGQMPLAEYSPQQAKEKLRDLNGVLVEFPLNFLCKANLTPGITSKEGLVPSAVFT
uniref:Phospholipase n=1 Tax=Haemonchus placei TaxID=6290 RepID=A0A0N4WZG3_HAEPC